MATALLAVLATFTSGDVDYDVVVYGSSPAGIAAATAAGQLGMSVAVYEPLHMIGYVSCLLLETIRVQIQIYILFYRFIVRELGHHAGPACTVAFDFVILVLICGWSHA